MSKPALVRRAKEAMEWLFDACFPLWSEQGVKANGVFTEALTLDYEPAGIEVTRTRVQARQTFVFAAAFGLGWAPDRSREIARAGVEALLNRARRPDGLVGRELSAISAASLDNTADLYDFAFTLFAVAEAKLNGVMDRNPEADAAKLVSALESLMRDRQNGGYLESLPRPSDRLQNPHMHLFEASLSAAMAFPEQDHITRAGQLLSLFQARFSANDQGLVGERFSNDWSEVLSPEVEPGHQFEWAWLLLQHAALISTPAPPEARQLYEFGRRTKGESGIVPLLANRDAQTVNPDYRSWPQAEALKAHLSMFEATRDEEHLAGACESFDCLMDMHLTPQGGWIEHRAADGAALSKTIPASSGYHTVLALRELIRVAGYS